MASRKDKETLNRLNEAWLTQYVTQEPTYNPLNILRTEDDTEFEKKIAWLLIQPEFFSFMCKHVMNIELLPFQDVVLKEIWNRKFPMYIASRGAGKTWLLALYSLLRALIIPNRKIIIAGASFRQSRFLHEYMETIWKNAPILRDLCDGDSGHTRSPDVCSFNINNSTIKCIPIGDGQKIRGYRANDLIVDEFASHNREIFETVLAGFGNVAANTVENVKRRAAIDQAKRENIDTNILMDQNPMLMSNQIVISGTAYYDWHFFGEYWKRWKQIIHSKGDTKKTEEIFGGQVPEDFDWKDYSVIRLPYELVPKGFMDDANIARSKASVHSGIFQNEYGACVDPFTQIITREGLKFITDVVVGDYVLTHLGRWKKVTGKTNRFYFGEMIKISRYGMFPCELVTPDHLFYNGETFTEALDCNTLLLPNLKELNNNNTIAVKNYTSNFVEREGYIYPSAAKNIIGNDMINTILNLRDEGNNLYQIYKDLGLKHTIVKSILDQKRPKTAINSEIKLDYNFGLCVGYYASEGSGGSNGKSIGFALDSHKDKSLEYFISQLSNSLEATFGIKPKTYSKKQNTAELTINSRIVFDLFKKICPGKCYDKTIDGDVLYSNIDFMKGFIIGFFNGDGHINSRNAIVTISGFDLLIQIRTVLSYFGIASSIAKRKSGQTKIRDKIYSTREAYILNLTGENYRKFISIFYDAKDQQKENKNIIINDGNNSIYRIKNIEKVPYSGLVYNLHVEEDESYCTLSACSHNCFTSDSKGFFKRSLIESCVASENNNVALPSGKIVFDAVLHGRKDCKYVIGIDPASEVDNFAIVVIEIHGDHRRIVHCWTTNRQSHIERVKLGLAKEDNFYSYAARKVRDLMKVFPTERIMIDSQGGGVAVNEALHETSNLYEGEVPIWPVIDDKKYKPSDDESGLHIIELVNFASAEWTSEANHGLRKDLEDRALLFPKFDPIILALAAEQDRINNKLYDTLEDCVTEIEELKNELVLIEITQTATGRDKWDTPELKTGSNKKGKMRKDRYSALIMANMGARNIKVVKDLDAYSYGGFSERSATKGLSAEYIGPAWFTEGIRGVY